ncbi:MAG: hypothetical protein AB7O55_32740 [Lautropia sp.]
MTPLHVVGMHGLGDNLHQRAIVRQLLQRHEVWLETPWPCVYHDMPALCLVDRGSRLRTQAKNASREAARYTRAPVPPAAGRLQVAYRPDQVRAAGSVLGAMAASCGVIAGDFRLPIPSAWAAKADALIAQWAPSRPLLIYRPLVERREWGGCPSRNPDHAAYSALFLAIRQHFFVVSIADLAPRVEWMVGEPADADVRLHSGELDFETIAALTARAGLVFCSPGFMVITAQAVGVPVACVFGGYESGRSFSAGARWAPYLPIEPIHPCECFSHAHGCRKAIDMPAALARLQRFVDETSSHPAIAA